MRSPHQQIRLALAVVLLLWTALAVADPISTIKPTGYVTDLAGVISPDTVQRLEALATEIESKTGAQIAVVTVRSLDGRPIEDYAVELFKHLGVGRKDNRGVLLLVAPSEHRYRFEVGYGLELIINDARAGDIGREMVPLLRKNDYSAAIYLGTRRAADLIAADRNVQLTGAPVPVSRQEPNQSFPWWALPFGIFLIVMFLRMLGGASRRGRRRSWWIGPMGGFGGWGGGGGFGGGGWGGGGFGGSSGGFGGFGGGSSGGGGASGSW